MCLVALLTHNGLTIIMLMCSLDFPFLSLCVKPGLPGRSTHWGTHYSFLVGSSQEIGFYPVEV